MTGDHNLGMRSLLAEAAYRAYQAATEDGGDGPCPPPAPEWGDLTSRERCGWNAAASAIVEAVVAEMVDRTLTPGALDPGPGVPGSGSSRIRPAPGSTDAGTYHQHLTYECSTHRERLGGCRCMTGPEDRVEVRFVDCVDGCPGRSSAGSRH